MTQKIRFLPAFLLLLLLSPAVVAEDLNRIVLQVNDEVATLRDYQVRVRENLARLEAIQGLSPSEIEAARQSVGTQTMLELLEELLLLSRAEQIGVEIPESTIDQVINGRREELGIESDDQFHEMLAGMGLTERTLREQIRNNFILQEVVAREVHPRIQLADEVLRQVYREQQDRFVEPPRFLLQEVVVLEDGSPSREELEAIARGIREEVLAGRALAEAVEESEAQGLTTGVIDLGWVSLPELDPSLGEAARDLEPGGLSEPVAGRGGLHLLSVLEREEARERPFREVKEEILDAERQRRFPDELEDYLGGLREAAYLRTDEPAEAAGFLQLASSAKVDPLVRKIREGAASKNATQPDEAPPVEPDPGDGPGTEG